MEKINKKALREWVAALRSGDYQQGRYRLVHTYNARREYCCLGVACHVFAERMNFVEDGDFFFMNGWKAPYSSSLPPDLSSHFDIDGEGGFWMDKEDANTLGISEHHILRRQDGSFKMSLIRLNDEYGFTFEQIADVIEKYFLGDVTNA